MKNPLKPFTPASPTLLIQPSDMQAKEHSAPSQLATGGTIKQSQVHLELEA